MPRKLGQQAGGHVAPAPTGADKSESGVEPRLRVKPLRQRPAVKMSDGDRRVHQGMSGDRRRRTHSLGAGDRGAVAAGEQAGRAGVSALGQRAGVNLASDAAVDC